MIKKLALTLFTSLLLISAFGQNDKDEIRKTFNDYFQTVEEKNNVKTLDYLYPKIFEYIPKDKMLEAMEKMKADTSILITFSDNSLIKISETIILDETKYALINYSFKMKMKLNPNKDKSKIEGESDSDLMKLTFEMFKERYGDKNVTYNQEKGEIDILMSNQMYAIYSPPFKDWKFIEKKENFKPIINKLLPEKIIKSL